LKDHPALQTSRTETLLRLTCVGRDAEALGFWTAEDVRVASDTASATLIAVCLHRLGRPKDAHRVLEPLGNCHDNALTLLRIMVLRSMRRRSRALRRVLDLRGLTSWGWLSSIRWAMRTGGPTERRPGDRRLFSAVPESKGGIDGRSESSNGVLCVSRVVSVRDFVAKQGGRLIFAAPTEAIRFAEIRDWRDPVVGRDDTVAGYSPYVAALSDVCVAPLSNLIYAPDGNVVSDTYAEPDYGRFVDPRGEGLIAGRIPGGLLTLRSKVTGKVDRAIHLCGLASGHFGHWFSEYMPKLRHFERLSDFSRIPILVNDGMPTSHFDFLALVCRNPLIRVGSEEFLEVGELLVAPTITFYPFDLVKGHAVPETAQAAWSGPAFAYLRDRVLEGRPQRTGPGRAIYLSRRNSTWGLVVNELQVETALAEIGVETVLLERMTFSEQVACMQGADVIVAPTGSALNSVIFADPGTTILVLGQAATHNWGGWAGPLRDLGFDPKFHFVADARRNEKHVALKVDTTELCRAVETLKKDRHWT
jgi:Glycosyltransferase 61